MEQLKWYMSAQKWVDCQGFNEEIKSVLRVYSNYCGIRMWIVTMASFVAGVSFGKLQ